MLSTNTDSIIVDPTILIYAVEETLYSPPDLSITILEEPRPRANEQTKSLTKDHRPRIATVANANKIKSWMADTGASTDVIDKVCISEEGQRKVRHLKDELTYETAAGDVIVNSAISRHSQRIGKLKLFYWKVLQQSYP